MMARPGESGRTSNQDHASTGSTNGGLVHPVFEVPPGFVLGFIDLRKSETIVAG